MTTITNGNSNGSAAVRLNSATSQSLSHSDDLTQRDRDEIIGLLALLKDKLPPLRDLTAAERQSLSGMGDKNRTFAGKVLEVILQHPDFLPRSFDIAQYQSDLATFDNLSAIAMALTQLCDLVNATTTAIGSEIYDDALTAYRHAKASEHGASMEAMMADMKQRFAQQSKKKEKKTEKPEVQE